MSPLLEPADEEDVGVPAGPGFCCCWWCCCCCWANRLRFAEKRELKEDGAPRGNSPGEKDTGREGEPVVLIRCGESLVPCPARRSSVLSFSLKELRRGELFDMVKELLASSSDEEEV